jgi:hypothetical protein
MAVCCQNLMLGALSSRSAFSLLVGALFKKFGLFLNRVVYDVLQFGLLYLIFMAVRIFIFTFFMS